MLIKFGTRKRVINTQFLVTFTLKLVLSKNSQGYKILLNELWETSEFSGLQKQPASASSIYEARQKMPETIFTLINQEVLAMREESDTLPKGNASIKKLNISLFTILKRHLSIGSD